MVLVISRQDIERILTMKDTIEIVEEGFRQLDMGNVTMPQRATVSVKEHQGIFLVMPACVSGMMNVFSNKIVTVYPNNPERHGLPTTLASISLHDIETGTLVSCMDGSFITAMRTGAVSGIATKHLARKDSRTVGVLGAGVQARTQLEAICEVLEIENAKVYGLDRKQTQHFCKDMAEKLEIRVDPCEKSEDVVRGSDVTILATSSKTPVLDGNWLDKGTHINAIGSHTPTTRELDDVSVQRSKIVVDLREAALSEAGDLLIPMAKGVLPSNSIYADLGELVTGKKEGRTNNREITLFKSVGLAIQDAATAYKVYGLAKERGLGKTVSM